MQYLTNVKFTDSGLLNPKAPKISLSMLWFSLQLKKTPTLEPSSPRLRYPYILERDLGPPIACN